MPVPQEIIDQRRRIAAPYLRGGGIEIGALDAPTPLPEGATVRYVDFRTVDELSAQYPKLDASRFVHVDVVDDGEKLATFGPASVDWICANHMLEHCENPLGTIRTHLDRLREGGWLFYALPERRLGFDAPRPVTTFEHLVADDCDGGVGSRHGHYLEWARLVNGLADPAAAEENARVNMERRYSIHFHVWDASAWLDFLARARDYLRGAFEVRHFEFTGNEIVCVLRKS